MTEHNQEKYEEYFNHDVDSDTPLENCQCEMCKEETRILLGDFMQHEIGLSKDKTQSNLRNDFPELF